MTIGTVRAVGLGFLLALAPASAGASGARPPVALTASPAHVELAGAARATVRVTNAGVDRVVLDVRRAGFALDLRGRPRIVPQRGVGRSAATWLSVHPRMLALKPDATGAVTIGSRLPPRAEPGDHDALVLFTTRRRAEDGVAVRMRMGVVVVVRAPGTVVRRLELRGLRVASRGRARVLELVVANRGNVTESFTRTQAIVSLHRAGRRVARLTADPSDLRPGTRGVLQFRYRGSLTGRVTARVDVTSDSGRILRRTLRVRL